METIKYRIINGTTNEPMNEVYVAKVKPEQTFTDAKHGKTIELRRCKDMIINIDGFEPLQPRTIKRKQNGIWELGYGWAKGKSWSQYTTFCEIAVVDIN